MAVQIKKSSWVCNVFSFSIVFMFCSIVINLSLESVREIYVTHAIMQNYQLQNLYISSVGNYSQEHPDLMSDNIYILKILQASNGQKNRVLKYLACTLSLMYTTDQVHIIFPGLILIFLYYKIIAKNTAEFIEI